MVELSDDCFEREADRFVYIVIGSHSLPYAALCFASLLRNSLDVLRIFVLTDSDADAEKLAEAFRPLMSSSVHFLEIFSKEQCDRRADAYYQQFPAIRTLRAGHPCWRKVTDPPLFAQEGEEVIVIDPDVYFPNPFSFEPTPDLGIQMMWQAPNCLLPEEVVRRAFIHGTELADHTDIGVCQYRSPLPLSFIEQLVAVLSRQGLPRSMHVESIIWAALAIEMGGGYLEARSWFCFANTIRSRIVRRLAGGGASELAKLNTSRMKAFHAGGVAKYWLASAEASGTFATGEPLAQATAVVPYRRYSRAAFERKFRYRRIAAKLGLYRLLGAAG